LDAETEPDADFETPFANKNKTKRGGPGPVTMFHHALPSQGRCSLFWKLSGKFDKRNAASRNNIVPNWL
jgi:hypothetical protein